MDLKLVQNNNKPIKAILIASYSNKTKSADYPLIQPQLHPLQYSTHYLMSDMQNTYFITLKYGFLTTGFGTFNIFSIESIFTY